MTPDAERRRPLFASFALLALICAALIVPLFLNGSDGDLSSGGTVQAASRDTVAITSPVTVLSTPRVVVERGAVTLTAAGASASTRESVLLALISGGGADLILDSAKVVIGQPSNSPRAAAAATPATSAPPAGDSNPVALGPIVGALSSLSFRTLYLNDVTAVVNMAGGGEQVLRNVDGEIARDRKGGIRAKVKFNLRGEPLQFDAELSPPGASGETWMPIRIALKGQQIDARLEGRLAASGERMQITSSNADLTVPNLRQAAQWLDSDWPSGQGLGDFSAHGPVVIDDRSIAFDNAHFTLDGNAASGALSLTIGHGRPAVEGTLAFINLDVAPYVALPKTDTLAIATNWIAHLPIPGLQSRSLVRTLDADLRISARTVAIGSDTFGRCAASLTIKDGKLFAELAEMELEHGGNGEGQMTIDMMGPEPRYNVRATLEDVDVGRVIGARLTGSGLEGVGKLSFDLSGDGGTDEAIRSSLSGTVALDLPQGARVGLDPDALARVPASPAQPAVGWGAITGKTTAVDAVTAHFAAQHGVFTAERVEITTPERIIKAVGTVSADDQSVDMNISMTPADGTVDVTGTANGTTTAPACRVQGPWAAPSISSVPPPGKSAQPLSPDGTPATRPNDSGPPLQDRG